MNWRSTDKRTRCLSRPCTFLVILTLTTVSHHVRAQGFDGAPRTMSFQGVLTNAVGVPVADGTYGVHFTLYNKATAGSKLWQESQSVTTSGGVYSVILGSVTPLDLAFDRQVWLGVKVESDSEISPRIPLTSVPYAFALRNLRIVDPETDTDGPNMVGGWSGNAISGGNANTIAGGGAPGPGANSIGDGSLNVIGGGANNVILGASASSVIAGGQSNTIVDTPGIISGGSSNTVSDSWATVAGGIANTGSGYASTVSGGNSNAASGLGSTVAGGASNQSGGLYSMVAGGVQNAARGNFSFVAGQGAKASHDGSFVWSDPVDFDTLSTTAQNQFLIRASGGVGIGTNQPQGQLHVKLNSSLSAPQLFIEEAEAGDFGRIRIKNATNSNYWDIAAGSTDNGTLNLYTNSGRGNVLSLNATGDPVVAYNGAKLTDGGMWTNNSSRDLKTDLSDVDASDVLEKVAKLPVRTWRYKVEPETVAHIGPMSQDFYEAFGLGEDPKTIGTVDADGVALAAIQALYELVQSQRARIESLEYEVSQLRSSATGR